MKRIKVAIVACVSMVAVALSAVPAEAATNPVVPTATSAVSEPQNRAAPWVCWAGYSCYYDNLDGTVPVTPPLRCGVHDLRGGPYENRINGVFNASSVSVWLDIWSGSQWVEYAHVAAWTAEPIYTNHIGRIRIGC